MPNYNAMGPAKAALEASVRYLAVDFGSQALPQFFRSRTIVLEEKKKEPALLVGVPEELVYPLAVFKTEVPRSVQYLGRVRRRTAQGG